MNNKKNKSVAYRILVLLAILIPVILGLSYAYFLTQIYGNNTNISGGITSTFVFDLQTDNDGYINASDLVPISIEEIETLSNVGEFSVVTGNNSNKVVYSISLVNISISNNLKSEDFKWSLECTNDNSKSIEGNFANVSGTSKILLSDLEIESNSTDNYILRLYIEDTGENQISMINGTFSAKVAANAKLLYEE